MIGLLYENKARHTCSASLWHLVLYTPILLFLWFPSYDGLLAAAKSFGVKKGVAFGISLALVYFIVFLTYSTSFW